MSFVIPCFNHGELVDETVASIRQIGEEDRYEIILVDDGSTDIGCRSVLDKLAATGVHLLRQANQGLGAARNNGIRRARGRYILPVDSDNRIRPAYYHRSVEMLETDPEIGVVFSDVQFFGEISKHRQLKPHDPAQHLSKTKLMPVLSSDERYGSRSVAIRSK